MGISNYLIEGVSGTGKTSVATELQRRGYHVIHGDRELASKGDPQTGEPLDEEAISRGRADFTFGHRHHVWPVEKVRALMADKSHAATFFCGGSRNSHQFIELFDAVFVLDVDRQTLRKRLENRPDDEFGGRPEERDFVLRLHESGQDLPRNGTVIDATLPLAELVDDILTRCGAAG
ncbi:AAA family ATPase [Rhizobium sp. SL86]|uniref:AAA family ATPase n=1 Tax=Rhizobium sp. SL86 TaxID=2995148 RepID=UPI002273B07E|nr:AAA family ATPase [Rhizobium sp. SL86]MCY1664072.1 nucleoside kinase [Rhizobium sp. SL86]